MADPEIDAARSHALKRSGRAAGINPLIYPEWDSLVEANAGSSFFHRTAWARILHETYGHLPIYFCRFVDGRLEELLAIMEVSSPWTGCRGSRFPSPMFALRSRVQNTIGGHCMNGAWSLPPLAVTGVPEQRS